MVAYSSLDDYCVAHLILTFPIPPASGCCPTCQEQDHYPTCRQRSRGRSCGVPELAVAATGSGEKPPILREQAEDLADFCWPRIAGKG